jgi:flagellar protein FliT
MSHLNEILACQAELAAHVARMVDLARERRWETLSALDTQGSAMLDRLRWMQPGELSPVERSLVAALAGRIRADQDELARLLRPQFQQLLRRMAELQHAS